MTLFETILAILAIFNTWFGFSDVPASPIATTTIADVVSVIDGDTIKVNINGQEETVRYIGIDTPEPYREGEPECGSKEATISNRNLVEGKSVELVADVEDRDKYHRLLRYVYVGEGQDRVFVNTELIKSGLAQPLSISPNTTKAKDFEQLATEAKDNNLGSWALCPDF